MAVAVGSSAFIAAVCCAVAGLFGQSSSLFGDVLGVGGGKSRVQYTGGGYGYGDTDAAASGADTIVGTSDSGDVDQSWAFFASCCVVCCQLPCCGVQLPCR